MNPRRWLDSETSVVVWHIPYIEGDGHDAERYTIVFYGKHYVHYDEKTGKRMNLCIKCDAAGEYYYWRDISLKESYRQLGERRAWGRVPNGVAELVMFEFRRDLPDYHAISISDCPRLLKRNDRNYYGK